MKVNSWSLGARTERTTKKRREEGDNRGEKGYEEEDQEDEEEGEVGVERRDKPNLVSLYLFQYMYRSMSKSYSCNP